VDDWPVAARRYARRLFVGDEAAEGGATKLGIAFGGRSHQCQEQRQGSGRVFMLQRTIIR
jgi:hypothetical protein